MMCVRCVWELPHATWWIEIAARLLALWPASRRLWTLPGARLEPCIRTAPPCVAAIHAVFDGRSHAGVVLRARYFPSKKVAWNRHKRGKSYGRRYGQDPHGPMDRGAAGRGREKDGGFKKRVSGDDARWRPRRTAERRSGALA